jgi:hypothetical protein
MTADEARGAISEPAHHMLRIYLNDHLAGAAAGAQLADRVARANETKPAGRELSLIARQIHEDHQALLDIMRTLGVRPRRTFAWLGRGAELAGRLKPNGRLVRRSPLAGLVEIEALRLGVLGKLQGWRVLALVAECDQRLDGGSLAALESKAERQAEILGAVHLSVATPLAEPGR